MYTTLCNCNKGEKRIKLRFEPQMAREPPVWDPPIGIL